MPLRSISASPFDIVENLFLLSTVSTGNVCRKMGRKRGNGKVIHIMHRLSTEKWTKLWISAAEVNRMNERRDNRRRTDDVTGLSNLSHFMEETSFLVRGSGEGTLALSLIHI